VLPPTAAQNLDQICHACKRPERENRNCRSVKCAEKSRRRGGRGAHERVLEWIGESSWNCDLKDKERQPRQMPGFLTVLDPNNPSQFIAYAVARYALARAPNRRSCQGRACAKKPQSRAGWPGCSIVELVRSVFSDRRPRMSKSGCQNLDFKFPLLPTHRRALSLASGRS
jgi:hypothetical protein